MSGQQAPAPVPQGPPIDLATANFRVRRIFIKADIDVYDDDGFLIARGPVDEMMISEVNFYPALVAALSAMTNLGRGFAVRPVPVGLTQEPPPAAPTT